MEKHYQPIDGENITFDKYVVEEVLGVPGEVIEAKAVVLGKVIDKYAFYNTGELCEVLVENGSTLMCVKCHGNRRKDVLHWLKQYLTNGMKYYGWETDIVEDNDDYFYAAFYQEQ